VTSEHDDEDASIAALKELIDYVARALVDDPDAVEVTAIEDDRTMVFELSVDPKDLGKVIGREGRTARAIRTVLAASSSRLNMRTMLEILE